VRPYDESVIRFNRNGVRWQLDPDFAPTLDQVLGDAGQIVKESPAKRVTLHHVGGRAFYVKRYRNDAVPLRGAKFFFKPSHSRREWHLALEIQRRGVPLVRHLAYGERWAVTGLCESLLITEAFDGQSLLEFPDRGASETQAALGRLVRQMHNRGVVQFDLAPNILVRARPLELRRVDVHHAQVKDALSDEERLDNLAWLNSLLPLGEAFFTAYGWRGEQVRRTLQRSVEVRRAFLRRRARRCLKRNAEFAPRDIGGLRWQVRLPRLSPVVETVLREPDHFLATRAEILKPGRSSTVGKADDLVLKRYNLRKFENLFKDLFRPSKARRAFHKAYHLELVGVSTARPIATADRRWLRWLGRSYFLMEEIPGAKDLGQWHGDTAPAIHRVAELVARLHNEGFRHRDLKETNLVFDREQRVFLLDLEGLEFPGVVSPTRAGADLARLLRGMERNFSAAARGALLDRYCALRGVDRRTLAI